MAEYQYGCETICNEKDIFPAMKDLVENKGMNVNAAAKFIHDDSKCQVTQARAEHVYRSRTPPLHKGNSNPVKTQTKPETKIKISEIAKEIREGQVSDDHAKEIGDALADAIKSKKCAPRVAARTVNAFKQKDENKERKKEFKNQFPEKSRIQILNSKLEHALEELKFLVQGDIEKQGGDEIWIKAIATKGPSFIWQFHKLGIDLNKVYQTLINPGKELNYDSERKEGKERQLGEEIIDIDP